MTNGWQDRLRSIRAELSAPPTPSRAKNCLASARILLEEFCAWRDDTQRERLSLGALDEDSFVEAATAAHRAIVMLESDLNALCNADTKEMPAKRDRAVRSLAGISEKLARSDATAQTLTTGQEEARTFLAAAGLDHDLHVLLPHALATPQPLLLLRNRAAEPTDAKKPLREIAHAIREKGITVIEWQRLLGLWAEALSGPVPASEALLIHDALPLLFETIRANKVRAVIALMPGALALGIAVHRAQEFLLHERKIEVIFYTPKDASAAEQAKRLGATQQALRQHIAGNETALLLDRVAEAERFSAVEEVLREFGHGVVLRGALLASSAERQGLVFCGAALQRVAPKQVLLRDPPLCTTASDMHKLQPKLSDQMLALAQTFKE